MKQQSNTTDFVGNGRQNLAAMVLSASILCSLSGCRMMGLTPAGMMGGYSGNIVESVNRQEDPELVRQGVPSFILLLDAMLVDEPDNPELLRAAATIYATYAQAFVVPGEASERAVILYRRAKDYGLRLLSQRAFFASAKDGTFEAFEKALPLFSKRDVPDLYAAGNAWLGWILSQPDSMAALADLSKALALTQRVLDLDESYANGGAHLVFGIYYAVQPPGGGRDLEKSDKHFQRAIQLAGDDNFLPQVLYAEFYAITAVNEGLFVKTLENVLSKEAIGQEKSSHALSNAIARERAKRLLGKKDDYF